MAAIARTLPATAVIGARTVRTVSDPGVDETKHPEEATILRPSLVNTFIDEMQPYEGRLGKVLRITLSVILVVVMAMSLQVPEAVLSCYLIFFASRDDAGSGLLIATGLILAVTFLGLSIGIVVMQLSADEPIIRLFLMAAFTFVGMYLSQATHLGSLAATAGFVFAFALSLIDFIGSPELISHALSWIWVVVILPMGVLIFVNVLFGRSPAVLARRGIARRLEAAAAVLNNEEGALTRAHALLAEGEGDLRRFAIIGRITSYHSRTEARRICTLAPLSRNLLALSLEARDDPDLAQSLLRIAKAIQNHRKLSGDWFVPSKQAVNAPLIEMARHVARIWTGKADVECASAITGLSIFKPDIFSNPVYAQFAFKTVIAVFTSYAIYTAWDWFEIHTAMITCFYVALGSTGETLHKAALRITGALIGGAMGIASIIFLMPHMTDIGHLMILAGVGSFIAAWISTGSSLVQYMGWQMALAFFLCIMPTITTSFLPQGYAPVFDVDVATNRVLGIIIGNAIVAMVFLSFWPVSITEGLSKALDRTIAPMRRLLSGKPATLAEIWPNLAEARRITGLSVFEVDRLRMRSPLLPHAPAILISIESAAATLARVELDQSRHRYLFGAPRSAKAVLHTYESAASAFLETASSAMLAPGPQAKVMLMNALKRSTESFSRLQRYAARTEGRQRWRNDLMRTIADYARLQADFEHATKGLK